MSLPHLLRKLFLWANRTQLQGLCPPALSPSLLASSGYGSAAGHHDSWGLPGVAGLGLAAGPVPPPHPGTSRSTGTRCPISGTSLGTGTALDVSSGSDTQICFVPNRLLLALKLCLHLSAVLPSEKSLVPISTIFCTRNFS